MTLREIDPKEVATEVQDALLLRASDIAAAVGITDLPEPQRRPGPAWLAVHQLALYATTGVPPEHRLELIGEYLQSVCEYADWLDELGNLVKPATPLQVVIAAARAREALDADLPVTSSQLAVLASITTSAVRQLQDAGDCPKGRKYPRRQGKPRLVPADEARAWLSGRGVPL